jgi:FAD binding domain/Berberine and berberine like
MTTALRIAGLNGEPVDVEREAVSALMARLTGSLLLPDDNGFDAATAIWNGRISARPAVVIQPASTDDVRTAVDFSRERGLQLSIKGGGCHIAGISLSDGGITLDMSHMRSISVDPGRRRALVGPGCVNQDVDRATGAHGLATVLGYDPETGVAGLTLGGGFGYLTPRFGLSLDNLDEVEVVMSDGAVRRAAPDENQNLFWALRGGSGNFGVVTRFTYRLHDIGLGVTGGLLIWDAGHAADVFDAYQETVLEATRDFNVTLIMRLAPPAPFIPAEWHGKPVVGVLACHIGSAAAADGDFARLRKVDGMIADTVTLKPYVDQQALLGRLQPPRGMHSYWKSEFLGGLSSGVLGTLGGHAEAITSPLSHVHVFSVGGALNDHSIEDTAFANRDARFSVIAAACWSPGDSDADRHIHWARSTWEGVRPCSTGGNYINVQTADEDETRIRAAYRSNFEQLRRLKAQYDRGNFFRANRNIPPTLPVPQR